MSIISSIVDIPNKSSATTTHKKTAEQIDWTKYVSIVIYALITSPIDECVHYLAQTKIFAKTYSKPRLHENYFREHTLGSHNYTMQLQIHVTAGGQTAASHRQHSAPCLMSKHREQYYFCMTWTTHMPSHGPRFELAFLLTVIFTVIQLFNSSPANTRTHTVHYKRCKLSL